MVFWILFSRTDFFLWKYRSLFIRFPCLRHVIGQEYHMFYYEFRQLFVDVDPGPLCVHVLTFLEIFRSQ